MSPPATRVRTQLPCVGSARASSEWEKILSGRLPEGGGSEARFGEPLDLEREREDGKEILQ